MKIVIHVEVTSRGELEEAGVFFWGGGGVKYSILKETLRSKMLFCPSKHQLLDHESS